MNNDVKPNIPPPFRFRRPWETPPREEEPPPPPPLPLSHQHHPSVPTSTIPIKVETRDEAQIQQQDKEIKDVKMEIKVEKEDAWTEEVEVFSFDREKLVLTSEKVRVKRESTEVTSPTSPPSNSTSSSIDVEGSSSSKQSSGHSNSSSSRFMCSSGGSASSSDSSSSTDSSDQRRRRRKRMKTKNKSAQKLRKSIQENSGLKGAAKKTDLKDIKVLDEETIDVEGKGEGAFDDDDEIENEGLAQELDVNESNSELDDDEEDDDDEYDDDVEEPSVKLRLPADFPDFPGRNRERKNSKWADYGVTRKSSRLRSTIAFCNKSHKAQALKSLTSLLKKDPEQLTEEDNVMLSSFPELAEEARKRLEKRHLASERMKEEEDPDDQLEKKCDRLSQVISLAKYVVLYTGAGISTSASIPDYRGPNGIWTMLRKGQAISDDLKQVMSFILVYIFRLFTPNSLLIVPSVFSFHNLRILPLRIWVSFHILTPLTFCVSSLGG